MQYLKAVIAVAVAFTVIDLAWISLYLGDVYAARLSPIMRATPLALPAALFYVGYIGAIVYFAVRPALAEARLGAAMLNGAILGAVAYGTYTLTNHAIFNDWTWHLVVSDIGWGAFLTAASAACGYFASRGS